MLSKKAWTNQNSVCLKSKISLEQALQSLRRIQALWLDEIDLSIFDWLREEAI